MSAKEGSIPSRSYQEERAPRLVDPGENGWAEEPKVTKAESALFGPLAGVVRLLGGAAVATQEAYSLVCKHDQENVYADPGEEFTAYREAIQATWQLYENAAATHREIAEKAVALQRAAGERHGQPVEDRALEVTP